MTRKEEKQKRIELLKYLYGDLKLITCSENEAHWAIPYIHCFEGISSAGHPVGTPMNGWGIQTTLFNLVFHDAVISTWWIGTSYAQGDRKKKILYDVLCGNSTNWTLNTKTYRQNRREFARIVSITSKLQKKVFFDEMTEHEFLTEDYLVQRSKFSGGTEVFVNFRDSDYVTPTGKVVKAKSFLIL